MKKKGVISFEDIPGDHVFSVDLEKEDCIIVKNTGVEGVKGMSIFDSSKWPIKSRRLSTRAGDRGLEASPRNISATACGGLGQNLGASEFY